MDHNVPGLAALCPGLSGIMLISSQSTKENSSGAEEEEKTVFSSSVLGTRFAKRIWELCACRLYSFDYLRFSSVVWFVH